MDENTQGPASVGAAFTATDADNDIITWSLEGTNAALFDIDSTGQVTTRSTTTLDHEATASYSITVKAADGHGGEDSAAVTVNVTDVEEPPSVPGGLTVSTVSQSTTTRRSSARPARASAWGQRALEP